MEVGNLIRDLIDAYLMTLIPTTLSEQRQMFECVISHISENPAYISWDKLIHAL